MIASICIYINAPKYVHPEVEYRRGLEYPDGTPCKAVKLPQQNLSSVLNLTTSNDENLFKRFGEFGIPIDEHNSQIHSDLK